MALREVEHEPGGAGVPLPAIDWAGTPLGDPAGWSAELGTAARIVLASRFPSALVWGEALTTIHNAAFRAILGGKPDAQGRSFADVWQEVWEGLAPIAARAFAGEATFIEDFALEIDRHGYPERAWFTFCYSPVFGADGAVLGMIDTVVETTDRVLTEARNAGLLALGDSLRAANTRGEAIAAAAALLGTTLGAARVGYAVIDGEGDGFVVDADWTRDGARAHTGHFSLADFPGTAAALRAGEMTVVRDVAADARLGADLAAYRAMGAVSFVQVPLFERGAMVGVLYAHDDRPRHWRAVETEFLRAVADRTYAAVAKLQAEADQDLLNRELEHRLKNMMSMVQAIAAQTLRGVAERDAVVAFEQRIAALSRAHELLIRRSGLGTTVAAVVDAAVAVHGDPGRFAVAGPALAIGPRAALSLALLLHELATNAAKYGALGAPGGRVRLGWTIAADGPFTLSWEEQGGPPIAAPTRTGFGSRLIRMGLLNTRDVDQRFDPDGLRVTFRAPVAALAEG